MKGCDKDVKENFNMEKDRPGRFLCFLTFLCLSGVVFFVPALASAQFYEGARPAALGDAYSSIASGNEALYFNPAGMSLHPNTYNLDIGWAYNPTSGLNQFNASVIDVSTHPPMAFGLGFTYFFGNTVPVPRSNRKGLRLDFGLSYPMGTQKAIWGIDLKYLNMDINGYAGAFNTVTFDTGFLFAPSPHARVAVVTRNLTNTGRKELPYQSVIGVSAGTEPTFWISGEMTVNYFGLSWDEIAFQYAGGAEFFLGDVVALRFGYLYDGANLHQQYATTGLGIITEKVGFNVTYKQNIVTGSDRFLYLSLNVFLGSNN